MIFRGPFQFRTFCDYVTPFQLAVPQEEPNAVSSHPRGHQQPPRPTHWRSGLAPKRGSATQRAPRRGGPAVPLNYTPRRAPPIAAGATRARCTLGIVVLVNLPAASPFLPPLSNGGLNFPRTLCATYALASRARGYLSPARRANQERRQREGAPPDL